MDGWLCRGMGRVGEMIMGERESEGEGKMDGCVWKMETLLSIDPQLLARARLEAFLARLGVRAAGGSLGARTGLRPKVSRRGSIDTGGHPWHARECTTHGLI